MIITFPIDKKIDSDKVYDWQLDTEKFTKAFSKYLNKNLEWADIDISFDTYAFVSYSEKGAVGAETIKVLYKDFPENSSYELKCYD